MGNRASDAKYWGLDMGTNSVGWAVTNEDYELCRFKGKDMWGVRLFDEASTAAERRGHRTQRRRYDRLDQRLALLQEIFFDAITAVDPAFFQRLDAARLLPDDKPWKHTLFQDENFTDRDYHKRFPTIFHLRKALMEQDDHFDVRLVYLALHHILKKRGHFLFADLGDDKMPAIEDALEEIKLIFNNELEMNVFCSNIGTLTNLLTNAYISQRDKEKQLQELFDATDAQKKEWMKALAGGKAKLSTMFDDKTFDESEISTVQFSEPGYEDKRSAIEETIGSDHFNLLECWRAIYNWGVLQRLLGGYASLSEAKVALYEQNKKDLAEMKAVIRKYGTKELYQQVFHAPEVANNYGHLIGMVRVNGKKQSVKHCSHGEFCDYISKTLKQLEQNDRVTAITQKAQEQRLLPKLIGGDNSVIPYQLHKMELEQILKKASVYLPFLTEKGKDGFAPAEKVTSLLTFRIPYYVGPLNQHSEHAWLVRKEEGKIYPWNFKDKVDLGASATKFIDRMTGNCTYLRGCKVLPLCSPTYERFTVLNELNPLTINGEGISIELKQYLYESVFEAQKKPSIYKLLGALKAKGYDVRKEDLSGIDVEGGIKSSLKTTIALKNLLGTAYTDELAEEIVAAATHFGDDSALLRKKLKDELHVPQETLNGLLRLRCTGWGRLSWELLHETMMDINLGDIRCSLLEGLWHTNETLMGLLSRPEVKVQIDAHNDGQGEQTLDAFLKDLYASPAVKRQIHQAMAIVQELRKVTGHDPEKIFVEMTRYNGTKKQRTVDRKQQLLALYNSLKKEEPKLFQELQDADAEFLRRDKIFLYFLQMGKCMYSGQKIELDDLLLNKEMYDIDHIYPQCRVKDDSLDNRVLVLRTLNEEKGDKYPIATNIRKDQRPMWDVLLHKKLISQTKYDRLTRKTTFEDKELAGFIARQIVETSQSAKAVTQLLKKLMPKTEVVFVKAGAVSEFRHDRDMLKVRELNDLHHAQDAYLNIVVGNVYNTMFTHDPLGFVRKHLDKYTVHSKSLFKLTVKRDGVLAWNPEENGSIVTVRKTMAKNSPLITMMPVVYSGELFKVSPLTKGNGQLPLKKGLPIEKYGGYNSVAGACFMLVEHTQKKKRIRSLIHIPLHLYEQITQSLEARVEYCEKVQGLEEVRVLIPLVRKYTLLVLDGFRMYVTGRTGKNLSFKHASQLLLSAEWTRYLKQLIRFETKRIEFEKLNKKEGYRITEFDGITVEQNQQLYDIFIDKMGKQPYQSRMGGKQISLRNARGRFCSLSLEDQVHVLCLIQDLLAHVGITIDLRLIGEAKDFGNVKPSQNISSADRALLIHQSPTGLFEKVIDLKA